jgi:hypothetical protein
MHTDCVNQANTAMWCSTPSRFESSSDRRTRPYYILSQDSLRMVQHSANIHDGIANLNSWRSIDVVYL